MHREAMKMASREEYIFIDRVAIPGSPGALMLEREGFKPVAQVYRKEVVYAAREP